MQVHERVQGLSANESDCYNQGAMDPITYAAQISFFRCMDMDSIDLLHCMKRSHVRTLPNRDRVSNRPAAPIWIIRVSAKYMKFVTSGNSVSRNLHGNQQQTILCGNCSIVNFRLNKLTRIILSGTLNNVATLSQTATMQLPSLILRTSEISSHPISYTPQAGGYCRPTTYVLSWLPHTMIITAG